MIRNFILIAFRSLVKQKIYSTINILGFAISISACIMILLFVQYEMSYDKFFPKAESIYKVALERIYPEHRTFYSVVPHSFAEAIKRDFPEVENVLLMNGPFNRTLVTYKVSETEIKSFEEDHVISADSAFFDFFDLRGEREKRKRRVI